MASNSNRRSGSSGSPRTDSRSARAARSRAGRGVGQAVPGTSRATRDARSRSVAPGATPMRSVRIGDMEPPVRQSRAPKPSRGIFRKVAAAAIVLVILVVGLVGLTFTPAFTIDKVEVVGASHLTNSDVSGTKHNGIRRCGNRHHECSGCAESRGE